MCQDYVTLLLIFLKSILPYGIIFLLLVLYCVGFFLSHLIFPRVTVALFNLTNKFLFFNFSIVTDFIRHSVN